MNNIKKNIYLILVMLATIQTAVATKRRKFIPVQETNIGELLTSISEETTSLFYLVDKRGTPVTLQNIQTAIGSKSIKIPSKNGLNDDQKILLDTLQISVEENANQWVQKYLEHVKHFRSKKLPADKLILFNAKWLIISAAYSKPLIKIFRTMTLSINDAKELKFISNNKPISLLFFDDPFPAHTILGRAGKPAQDKLAEFIKRYN